MIETTQQAAASGVLANVAAVLDVQQRTVMPSGMRVIDVTPANGIAIRILPDRGFDLGQAHYRGVPLAWISQVGEVPPLADLEGKAWGDAFGGGLVVTCGLRNVGIPSEGHGLHGTFSHLRATDVVVDRVVEGDGYVTATATVVDDAPPSPLRVLRTITTYAGCGRVELVDVTTNVGDVDSEAPILYHLNFGDPLWSGRTVFDLPVASSVARDPDSVAALDSWTSPQAVESGPEWVLEHTPVATDGVATARVINADLGVELAVSWDTSTLPIVNQWIDRNPSMAVMAIEPANCTTRGRAHERATGTLPVLAAGEERITSLVIEARPI